MTLGQQLLGTARRLAQANPSKPRQADLRRAISTAYYALFHALAKECADRFIGTSAGVSQEAWTQVYRALAHGFAKEQCRKAGKLGFSAPVVQFADTFASLQEERHRADYDPDASYSRADVLVAVANAEQAMRDFRHADKYDRAAFTALVLFRKR